MAKRTTSRRAEETEFVLPSGTPVVVEEAKAPPEPKTTLSAYCAVKGIPSHHVAGLRARAAQAGHTKLTLREWAEFFKTY